MIDFGERVKCVCKCAALVHPATIPQYSASLLDSKLTCKEHASVKVKSCEQRHREWFQESLRTQTTSSVSFLSECPKSTCLVSQSGEIILSQSTILCLCSRIQVIISINIDSLFQGQRSALFLSK